MRIAFHLFAALCLAVCQRPIAKNSASAQGDDEERTFAELIDPIIDAAVNDGFGGEVSVMKDGALVYSRAAGWSENGAKTPVVRETLYQVSSMTKYFTAVLTLKAIEDGAFDVEADAATLFPQTAIAARDFTLRELLAHRSGLRSTYAAEAETDADGAVDAIARANEANLKDGEFHYSNDAYDLLAVLIEKTRGASYESVFREEIAAPAGLSHFGFWGEGRLDDPAYRGQPIAPIDAGLKRRNYGMIGSAGLLISTDDLVAFEHALASGRILSARSLVELRAPRGEISIGSVAYGSFLIATPLGRAYSARGAEDWGDNSYLNDYADCGVIVAVATSRGPAEGSGKLLYRDRLIPAIERELASFCSAARATRPSE